MKNVFSAALFTLLSLLISGTVWAQTIAEFAIPTAGSSPLSIVTGPDGALWFVEYSTNEIGTLTTTGNFSEFAVPTSDSEPSAITAGPDGALWFTEYLGNKIGRITTSGSFTEFPLPFADSYPKKITMGPDGALWFTELNKVGRITTAGSITEFDPYGGTWEPEEIVVGSDGALWLTEIYQGSYNVIGRVTAAGSFSQFFVPNVNIVTGLASGPDGALWFGGYKSNSAYSYGGSTVGRISTAGQITEFGLPSANTPAQYIPYELTTGPDGALWFTGYDATPYTPGNATIGRITTAGEITEFPLSSAGGEPYGISNGPDGALWFTELVGNEIGRITLGILPLVLEWPLPSQPYTPDAIKQDFGVQWNVQHTCQQPPYYSAADPEFHNGIDWNNQAIADALAGTPVVAAANGTLQEMLDERADGFAFNTVLQHQTNTGQKYTTVYWHILPDAYVRQHCKLSRGLCDGASVTQGQQIGTVAQLPPRYGTHLHFGVRIGAYQANASGTGALWTKQCGGFSGFPGGFIDPSNPANVIFH